VVMLWVFCLMTTDSYGHFEKRRLIEA
jgi:hypothetical protein